MTINFLKKDKRILALISVSLVIVLASGAIFYLNRQNNPAYSLKGYSDLKKEMLVLQKDSKIANNKSYSRLLSNLSSLEKKGLSKEEKFEILFQAAGDIDFVYADTNSHELYTLRENLDKLIRDNFPDKNWTDQPPLCMDPTCSDSPQPKEILAIINEINKSTVSAVLKEEIPRDLTNFGYYKKEDSLSKAYGYVFVAEDIRNNRDFTEAGLNIKISDEIIDFVKKTYPQEYKMGITGQIK